MHSSKTGLRKWEEHMMRIAGAFERWFAIFRGFVQHWWAKDRIRLSSTVGRWLSVRVGDSLLIREMLFEVNERTTMVSPTSSHVIFKLRRCDEHSDCDTVLRIFLEGPKLQFTSSTLTTSDKVIELFEEDAVIVPSALATHDA